MSNTMNFTVSTAVVFFELLHIRMSCHCWKIEEHKFRTNTVAFTRFGLRANVNTTYMEELKIRKTRKRCLYLGERSFVAFQMNVRDTFEHHTYQISGEREKKNSYFDLIDYLLPQQVTIRMCRAKPRAQHPDPGVFFIEKCHCWEYHKVGDGSCVCNHWSMIDGFLLQASLASRHRRSTIYQRGPVDEDCCRENKWGEQRGSLSLLKRAMHWQQW